MANERDRLKVLQEIKKSQAEINALSDEQIRKFSDNLDRTKAIARERQKLTDEKNAATRRGLGKRSTSSDLVNSVMQAGGKTLLDTVEKNSAQREANRELGEELDEQVLIVGSEGGTMMTTRDMQRVLQSDEPGKTMQNLSKNSVGSLASMFLGYSTTPSEFLPNKVDKNNEHMDNRTNDGLNREN